MPRPTAPAADGHHSQSLWPSRCCRPPRPRRRDQVRHQRTAVPGGSGHASLHLGRHSVSLVTGLATATYSRTPPRSFLSHLRGNLLNILFTLASPTSSGRFTTRFRDSLRPRLGCSDFFTDTSQEFSLAPPGKPPQHPVHAGTHKVGKFLGELSELSLSPECLLPVPLA